MHLRCAAPVTQCCIRTYISRSRSGVTVSVASLSLVATPHTPRIDKLCFLFRRRVIFPRRRFRSFFRVLRSNLSFFFLIYVFSCVFLVIFTRQYRVFVLSISRCCCTVCGTYNFHTISIQTSRFTFSLFSRYVFNSNSCEFYLRNIY